MTIKRIQNKIIKKLKKNQKKSLNKNLNKSLNKSQKKSLRKKLNNSKANNNLPLKKNLQKDHLLLKDLQQLEALVLVLALVLQTLVAITVVDNLVEEIQPRLLKIPKLKPISLKHAPEQTQPVD